MRPLPAKESSQKLDLPPPSDLTPWRQYPSFSDLTKCPSSKTLQNDCLSPFLKAHLPQWRKSAAVLRFLPVILSRGLETAGVLFTCVATHQTEEQGWRKMKKGGTRESREFSTPLLWTLETSVSPGKQEEETIWRLYRFPRNMRHRDCIWIVQTSWPRTAIWESSLHSDAAEILWCGNQFWSKVYNGTFSQTNVGTAVHPFLDSRCVCYGVVLKKVSFRRQREGESFT